MFCTFIIAYTSSSGNTVYSVNNEIFGPVKAQVISNVLDTYFKHVHIQHNIALKCEATWTVLGKVLLHNARKTHPNFPLLKRNFVLYYNDCIVETVLLSV